MFFILAADKVYIFYQKLHNPYLLLTLFHLSGSKTKQKKKD